MPTGYYRAEGIIKNVNTVEEYKNTDKNALLHQAGKTVSAGNPWTYGTISLMRRYLFAGLGRYKGRVNILLPFLALVVYRAFLCGPEDLQILVLVCFPRNPFGPSVVPGTRK